MALASNAREQMILRGEFSAGSFVPWIEAYARKLGLTGSIQKAGADRIELHLEGPPELVDAMEVGCLLGPIEIWVETIERRPVNGMAAQGLDGNQGQEAR